MSSAPRSEPPRVVVVYGTRPEAIKLGPVVRALRTRAVAVTVICTGQHRELLENAEAALAAQPEVELELMRPGQTPSQLIARAMERLDAALAEIAPSLVLAQGDTATAFVATFAAFHRKIPSGHVEAGLRTWRLDAPFPEEGYRQMIDRIATRLYAPTEGARANLLSEGRAPADVVVTGNTGIDAVLALARSDAGHCVGEPPFVLATLHRREAFGPPLEAICRALARIAREGVAVVLPVHPNPDVRRTVNAVLGSEPRVKLIAPLPYPDLVKTMLGALCVVTDSGGIQEEAPTLGVPVLVTRETTERPEAVEAGAAVLVGFREDRIVEEVVRLHRDAGARAAMAVPRLVYGDGKASERIADDVMRVCAEPEPSAARSTLEEDNAKC
jgi:UDP-N-acetylglucosamine 2-epimerase (non-hydrolysing)